MYMETLRENFGYIFEDEDITIREILLELDKAMRSNAEEEFPSAERVKCLWDVINVLDKEALNKIVA